MNAIRRWTAATLAATLMAGASSAWAEGRIRIAEQFGIFFD